MQYQPAYLFDQNNNLFGLAIAKVGVPKLESVNIWDPQNPSEVEDFKKTLNDLNGEATLKAFWPAADDPDVATLVDDPNWEPLALHPAEVPDWENSTIVDDAYGGIDAEKSTIVYKDDWIPDATEAQQRYYKAQETVARNRAGVVTSDAT